MSGARSRRLAIAVGVALAASSLTLVRPADAVASQPTATSSLQATNASYVNELLPAENTPVGWTGSVSSCTAGAPSAAGQAATLAAVNYYRGLLGLNPVSFDPALSAKAQQAALMMQANSQLSHTPPPSWTCATPDGIAAAGNSNLALGASAARAIDLYMDDSGITSAGHRRWVIDPAITTMGSGSTASANALYTYTGQPMANTGQRLPWPSAGYFPAPLEPSGQWSLSIADPRVNFTGATVSVTSSAGAALPVSVYPPENGYGPNTLVWKVSGLTPPSGSNTATYNVTVSGFTGASDGATSYSYSTTLFNPTPINSAAPQISGTVRVGQTVSAVAGSWTPAPATSTWQWYRNGVAIPGATGTKYAIIAKDYNKQLTVAQTVTAPGLTAASSTSASQLVKVGPKLALVKAPTISGTAKVGSTLRASAGKWKPGQGTTNYQWLRNGQPIKKATKASYKLVKADKGKRISVRVTAKLTGYGNGQKVSKATAVVKAARR